MGIGLLTAAIIILLGVYATPFVNWADHGPAFSMAAGAGLFALTAEEQKVKDDILASIKTQTEQQLSTRATAADIKVAIDAAMVQFKDIDLEGLRSMLKADTGVMKILIEQGKKLTELQEKAGSKEEATLSIRGMVEKWQKEHKEVISRVKNKERADLPALELRVASPMTPANTYNGSAYLPQPQFEAGIHELRRVQPTFWDYLTKGRTSSAAYVWVNKKNPLGAAAFIGPGVAKPGISFEIETEISNAKKIAVSEKVAIELLDDIDGMTSWVTNELQYQLKKKLNTTLMSGALSSTVPAGIQTISTTYTTAGIKTENANNFDAIRAVVAQLRLGFFGGPSDGPVVVFVNPVDAANMDLTKSVDSGMYLLPPFSTANGQTVAGASIVEDNNIVAGHFQAAMVDLFKLLIYKDMTITWGLENDDFTKNLRTAIAEMRIHSFHSDVDNNAFIYDTFAAVKAAIEQS